MKKDITKEIPEGLKQSFMKADGSMTTLEKGLTEKDWWTSKGRFKKLILTHGAVQKIADVAGISKDVQYTVLTQPDAYNNYQYTIQAKVCRTIGIKDTCVTEIGEANRSNLGGRGRANPANMAQKRAYDRCVFRLLGISGLLSEEELSDEEEEKNMDELSHEQKKKIAPMINKLLRAKENKDLNEFNAEMKKRMAEFDAKQLEYLRALYRKKVGEISKVKF